MEFGVLAPVADIAIKAPDVGSREIAEAIIVQSFQRAIDGELVDLLAPLRRALEPVV